MIFHGFVDLYNALEGAWFDRLAAQVESLGIFSPFFRYYVCCCSIHLKKILNIKKWSHLVCHEMKCTNYLSHLDI